MLETLSSPKGFVSGYENNQNSMSLLSRKSTLRLISWNCRQALHSKWHLLEELDWDVAIIQESAHPSVLAKKGLAPYLSGDIWAGRYQIGQNNLNKGLAVFTRNGYQARIWQGWGGVLSKWQDRLDILIPIEITGLTQFNLLAVWAFNNRDKPGKKHLEGPVQVAIQEMDEWINTRPTIIAGDFNNNAIWDKIEKANKFSELARMLDGKGFQSAYHKFTGEAFGKELTPTMYWQKITETGPKYHVDYFFTPDCWRHLPARLSVGDFEGWCGKGKSDHVPLVFDLWV